MEEQAEPKRDGEHVEAECLAKDRKGQLGRIGVGGELPRYFRARMKAHTALLEVKMQELLAHPAGGAAEVAGRDALPAQLLQVLPTDGALDGGAEPLLIFGG